MNSIGPRRSFPFPELNAKAINKNRKWGPESINFHQTWAWDEEDKDASEYPRGLQENTESCIQNQGPPLILGRFLCKSPDLRILCFPTSLKQRSYSRSEPSRTSQTLKSNNPSPFWDLKFIYVVLELLTFKAGPMSSQGDLSCQQNPHGPTSPFTWPQPCGQQAPVRLFNVITSLFGIEQTHKDMASMSCAS